VVSLDQIEREYGALRLVAELREGRYRPMPTRGVLIPGPGVKDEYRPLAISAVRDRKALGPTVRHHHLACS
jgi:RNA-directed DNA polymerase